MPCESSAKRIYFPFVSGRTKVRLQITWNLCSNKRYIFNYSLLHLLVSYTALNSKADLCSLLELGSSRGYNRSGANTSKFLVPFWHNRLTSFCCFATSTSTTEQQQPACVSYKNSKAVLKSCDFPFMVHMVFSWFQWYGLIWGPGAWAGQIKEQTERTL